MTVAASKAPDARTVSTWLVAAVAVLAPFVIVLLFNAVLAWSNRTSDCGQGNTAGCLQLAARNNAIVMWHAVAQALFVILGCWRIARTKLARIVFLALSMPVSALLCIVWPLSMAK